MASPVDVQVILCDAAVTDPTGRIHMLGAGWSLTGSPTSPHAVALLIKVPWDRTNEKIPVKLELLDADGQPVLVPTVEGERPLGAEQVIEVGRPAGVPAGVPLDAAFTVGLGSLPLKHGRYQWKATVAGQIFSAGFTVTDLG